MIIKTNFNMLLQQHTDTDIMEKRVVHVPCRQLAEHTSSDNGV